MIRKIPKVLLLVDTSRGSGRNLLYGIVKYSRLYGPWAFNRRSIHFFEYQTEYNKSRQLEEETLSRLEKWNANGIIATNINNQRQFERILDMGLPTIILGGYNPEKKISGWHRVRSNSLAIGNMAAEHLLNNGFRNFAYCGFYGSAWSQERGSAFGKRTAEADLETHFYEPPRSRTKRLWQNEQLILADWLNSLPKPLGIMACNDDRGRDILEACKIAGLNVPEEVSVIGVDNDKLVCELSEPPLSSIRLNNERGGYEAAELLAKLMAGEKISHQEIVVQPTDIITRESTDKLAMEDSNISKALRFIREHAADMIHVNDVVDAVAMSRRSLERRFCKVIGHSISKEIKRVHVNQFAKMLIETNMSVSQIASNLGHRGLENLNRYFRDEEGKNIQISVYSRYPKLRLELNGHVNVILVFSSFWIAVFFRQYLFGRKCISGALD